MQSVSRLIEQFIPKHYQLSIDLNRAARTFSGTVTIQGTAPKEASSVALHAKELTIHSVTVNGKQATWSLGKDDELSITPKEKITGAQIITIGFSGNITDAMHGLYPCYFEHNGKKKELLATQFESHHAREVFPCVDEPEAKATFDVTLITEQGGSVLGNMPIKTQAQEGDRLVTTFDTTPRMSTYLLAWVVGELHKKTATTKSGVEVNVWATPAQSPESLNFALDIATRTIDFFDDYFDTPYPLPKSDHVALPDFTSGAMENWGLVTYREVALLADPKTTGISSRRYIATVIAHELSHQWFGNLVTMKWWNNLWLNESFATLMEYVAVDALHPEWEMWLEFASTETIMALRRDSIDGVQPVQLDVHHPDEINTLFDPSIVYAKGACLLRMLQHYVGKKSFQAGLKAYFKKHAYQNTEGDDLWNALGEASKKDIKAFMNTWISQPGFPVVSVDQSGKELHLKQDRFFIGPHSTSKTLWPIPLDASNPNLPETFNTKEHTFQLASSDPVQLNGNTTAHFITHYDKKTLSQILDMVEHNELSPPRRLQLLHEQSMLARGKLISSAELIPLLDAYKNETSESVWNIISLCTGELKKFVLDDPTSEKRLKKLSVAVAKEQFARLGWSKQPKESEEDTRLRATIAGLMVYGEDEEAIKQAIQLYHKTPLEKLEPEVRPLIIGATVRHENDSATIDSLITAYTKTSSPDLQQDIASGLTSTKDKRHITRFLGLIKDADTIRPQDVTRWFVWLIRNKDGRGLAWQWLRDDWDWIEKTFGGDKSYDNFPRYTASSLLTRAELEEYKSFFAPKQKEVALKRVISVGISDIEGRVDLIEHDKAAVQEALADL